MDSSRYVPAYTWDAYIHFSWLDVLVYSWHFNKQ